MVPSPSPKCCPLFFFHSQEARLQGLCFEFLFLIGSNYKGPQGGTGGVWVEGHNLERTWEAQASKPVPTTPTCHPHPYKWKCKWRRSQTLK